jgi:hypothetical protein
MSYGINPETVEKLRPELTELEAGHPCKWEVAQDPLITHRKAYRIREALKIASRYPRRFPALAEAAKNFSIHIIRDGLIEARWKVTPEAAVALGAVPTHGGMDASAGKPQPSVGVSSAIEIIKAWRDHLPSSDPLHFVSTLLSVKELSDLYTWAVTNTPKLMLLVDESRRTLTLSLRDTSALEFSWHPPKAAPLPEKFDL